MDFERYETENGPRYAGVWVENADRFRYEKKADLDTLINDYNTTNNLPGISVAVIRDGTYLYRRGFGFADIAANATANSMTVYNAASVSKVIAGTLAAKLVDEGILRDDSTFTLDLNAAAASYIDGLPVHHTHDVYQLFSHLSCVAHYTTSPAIADQQVHYTSATTAMQSIWNVGLVNNCTPNVDYFYSSAAFTFAGAVMEAVTGKTVFELLKEELFEPYDLRSMRVMFEGFDFPENRLRATPYEPRDPLHTPGSTDFIDPPHPVDNPNVVSDREYADSSWKVLGGGIETNTYDLAKFGWKVLDAQILSTTARDNILWTPVRLNYDFGLGWQLRTNALNGLDVAQWTGSWEGARSALQVYINNGVVIAIMSNRRNHRSNRDIGDLVDEIGDLVLSN